MQDDVERIAQEMAAADGVILGTPTYNSGVSAQMKTLMDRGHLVIEQGLHQKHAIGIVTGENYGAGAAAAQLRKTLAYAGASVTAMIKHVLPFSSAPELDAGTVRILEQQADRLVRDIRTRRVYPLQALQHALVMRVGIRPFVLKKGKAYQGVLDRWQKLGLIK